MNFLMFVFEGFLLVKVDVLLGFECVRKWIVIVLRCLWWIVIFCVVFVVCFVGEL